MTLPELAANVSGGEVCTREHVGEMEEASVSASLHGCEHSQKITDMCSVL